MNVSRLRMAIIVVIALSIAACSDHDGTAPTAPAGDVTQAENTKSLTEDRTPFQLSLLESSAQRVADGMPAPTITFDFKSDTGVPLSTLQQQGIRPGETVTIVATTVVHYDNPEQSGQKGWPAIVIDGSEPADPGWTVQEGDYTQAVIAAVEQASPGFWQRHPYGQEPRTYTYIETIIYSYPVESEAYGPGAEATVGSGEIVTGLSIPGPELDYTLDESLEIAGEDVASVLVGFQMDWFFGIRLPLAVSLDGPTSVLEGASFEPTSIAQGLNWSAADFENAGIPGEAGNEFGMRFNFFLGIRVDVLGATVIQLGPDIDEDASDSFTTPLGPGEVFNLPTIDVPLVDEEGGGAFIEIGFTATPQAGSDEFRAAWQAAGEASGGGFVFYTTSAAIEDLGPVLAIDGPGAAELTLDEFEYVFNQYMIALGLFTELGIDAGIFGSESFRFDIPVTSFDLSNLFPDLAVGVHDGSSPTSVSGAVSILNVAPTAEIDLASATLINGVPAFLVETGVPYEFSGSSFDPGRDDLTATWDFGDGAPSPDISTFYPLGAPVGPNVITDNQMYEFDDPCLNIATFKVTDDDGASSEDTATVISIPPAGSSNARLAGYWQHQFSRVGMTDFEDSQLECLLGIIGFMSTVFDEERDASKIGSAYDVLFMAQNFGSAQEKLDRQLLVTWLNFTQGVFGYTELVDTNNDGVVDAQLVDVIAAAEAIRLNRGATVAQIRKQSRILHNVNVSAVGGGESILEVTKAGQ